MRTPFLLALLLASAPAAATDDPPQDRSAAAVAYQQEVMGHGWETAQAVVEDLRVMIGSSSGAATAYARGVARIDDAIRKLQAVPPFDGDASLRDGEIDVLRAARDLMAALEAEARWLDQPGPVGPDAIERLEALFRRIDEDTRTWYQRELATQRAFAERHGFRLVETGPPEVDAVPRFVAPGVPPAGSEVPGTVWVSLAIRYQNDLVEPVIDAWRELEEIEIEIGAGDDAEPRRVALFARVRALRARLGERPPFAGDARLRDAVLANLGEFEALLSGPLKQLAAASGRALASQAEVDAYNAVVTAYNLRAPTARAQLRQAQDAFLARWQVAAFRAWEQDVLLRWARGR